MPLLIFPYLQKLKAAHQFYDDKVTELGNNLKELEVIVQRKQVNVRAVEEGMSIRISQFLEAPSQSFANEPHQSFATKDYGCSDSTIIVPLKYSGKKKKKKPGSSRSRRHTARRLEITCGACGLLSS